MSFSCSPRKVPKEGDLRRRYEKAPSLRIPPPLLHPTPENVPIFRCLQRKNLQVLHCRCSKIGTFLDTGRRCGGGFQRGRIFVAPLWPPSLVTFLAAKKVTRLHQHNCKKVYVFAIMKLQPPSQKKNCIFENHTVKYL